MTCIDTTSVVAKQHISPGKVDLNLARLKSLTKDIRHLSDCDNLKMMAGITGNEISDFTADLRSEAEDLLSKLLGISKPPSPNPVAIVKWIKKQTTAQVSPQLQAVIKLTSQAISYIAAAADLLVAIEEAREKILECARSTVDAEINASINDITGLISDSVHMLEQDIIGKISDAVCGGLQSLGISAEDVKDVLAAYNSVSQVIDIVKTQINIANDAIGQNISGAQECHDAIVTLTQVPSSMDFSSPAAFSNSVSNGSFAAFQSNVTSKLNSAPPVMTVAPVVSGNNQVGQTLATTNGVWTDSESFEYQWYADDAVISGQTVNTLNLTLDMASKNVYCVVSAENTFNVTDATTNNVHVIFLPDNIKIPSISGTLAVGNTVIADAGSWYSIKPIAAPAYQWYANNAAIGGATANSYLITIAEQGKPLMVSVTVTNSDGATTANSNPTSVIP